MHHGYVLRAEVIVAKKAVIIGAGIGGLSLAMRLQARGFDTTVVDKLDKPGGRAYVREHDGFTFDMGPTVLTVPHFIEELFALERGDDGLAENDFPPELLGDDIRIREGNSGGPRTREYVTIRPILPFYRIYFDDKSYFDYNGDHESTIEQIHAIEPRDVEGYHKFHAAARAVFERGFLELGYTYFGSVSSMVSVVPDLFRLDAVRNLFRFTSKYFISDKLRQVFSFETLLVGGNPLAVPAIYSMIHFVEKTWGIHYAMGGTGALVKGFVKKFEELGGTLILDEEVRRIETADKQGNPAKGWFTTRYAKGVTLESGTFLPADVVASNADWAHTYMDLVEKKDRFWNNKPRAKLSKYSMSLVVIYFGFKKTEQPLDLQHHNIILGPRYEALLNEIFEKKILAKDFSQYLHIPTITDPQLAPEGCHSAYTLIPVPHNGSGLDWSTIGPGFVDKILQFLDDRGYIPGLMDRLVTKSFVTPDYFEGRLNSLYGNAFGLEPVLRQSAWFRPHNRSEDIANLYMVGANAQPGAGTPSVMMSAKMTARCVAEDHPDVEVSREETERDVEAAK
ncbi:MAG: phytoene desaturase [bacterium]|jgi:phytoene desaturase